MKRFLKFTMLVAVTVTFLFVQCKQEATDVQPSVNTLQLQTKSMSLGKGNIPTKLKVLVTNGDVLDLDSAVGVLDLIELRTIDDELIQVWDSIEPFDFLDLEKGILNDVAIVPIPPGVYTEAICRVTSSKVVYQGKDYDCVIPGGDMILSFEGPLLVGAQLSPEITLTIDVSKTFVPLYHKSDVKNYQKYQEKLSSKPNWKKEFVTFENFKKGQEPIGFLMDPVIKAINSTSAGSIAGAVLDLSTPIVVSGEPGFAPVKNAVLSLYDLGGNLVAETISREDQFVDEFNVVWNPGDFLLKDIPEGNYKLTVEFEGMSIVDRDISDFGTETFYTKESFDIFVLRGNFNFIMPDGAVLMLPDASFADKDEED